MVVVYPQATHVERTGLAILRVACGAVAASHSTQAYTMAGCAELPDLVRAKQINL